MLVVSKPPGLSVVPGAGERPGDCVRGRLERQVGARLWVVHRLDRETSGVLLFARTPEIHRTLCLAFEERRVRKSYVAFTLGVPSPRESRIATPLHPARRGKVRPAAPGEDGAWDAATRYIVRKSWERLSTSVALVEAHPETGRHHQNPCAPEVHRHAGALRQGVWPAVGRRVGHGLAGLAPRAARLPARRAGPLAGGAHAHLRGAARRGSRGAASLARWELDGRSGRYFFAWVISAWSSRE